MSSAETLFSEMRHPYSQALLESIPDPANPSHTRLQPIPGRPPNLLDPPAGCAFAARCRYARADCLNAKPSLDHSDGTAPDHVFACYHPVGTADGAAALAANREAGTNAAGLSMTEAEGELV